MTDIPALIEEADKVLSVPASLMGGESFVIPIDLFVRMKNALSRLTVPPLRDEIAGLAALLRSMWRKHEEDDQVFDKAAAALERQAREIERLNVILANHGVIQLEKTEIMLAQKERIRELESEADNLDQRFTLGQARIKELEAEKGQLLAIGAEEISKRNARIAELEAERDCLKDNLAFADERNRELLEIRAKTIEECAQVAGKMTGRVRSPITTEVAVAIRALLKPSAETE